MTGMSNEPLVSIIIPFFNSAIHLEQTIRSALAQTWMPIEIILVDDGSTDCSLAIAQGHECRSVRIVTGPQRGACAARNIGIGAASGQFLQFLDSDDLLGTNKIARQVAVLRANSEKVASCRWVRFT